MNGWDSGNEKGQGLDLEKGLGLANLLPNVCYCCALSVGSQSPCH